MASSLTGTANEAAGASLAADQAQAVLESESEAASDGISPETALDEHSSEAALDEHSPEAALDEHSSESSQEGAATDIRIPANLWALAGIGLSVAFITAIVAGVRIHMRRKEEQDLLARRKRRLERLEDIGFSSSDFDQLVAQRRIQSTASRRPGRRSKRRRNKKSFVR